ncbi:MAG: energy-coupling factor ABC transporter permease [Spirochaetaceae bacterium]|jgi:cobalt/nickel transport system permease protein|nr:energy-coupling factor ABC transporter permease [Spirochaetaceae bacterium]
MHMSDALISPIVGGTMLAVSAAAIGFSVKKIAGDKLDEKKIPMMGIMGAFVFAGQMINFTIPGTGSSGHIGGGILLAALLGPYPALISLASVLLIQCLFFADGGLLAYGCNVFNMGVTSCLLAYTFIYKPLVKRSLGEKNKQKIFLASIIAVVAGLQVGAFGVVLETLASGVSELPFSTFVLLMQPIHLAIGLVEGLVTAAVLCYVEAARPELIESVVRDERAPVGVPRKKILISFGVLTVLVACGLSIFASAFPDGLEWAMEKTAGTTELEREGAAYSTAAGIVERTAFLPDYGFKGADGEDDAEPSIAVERAGTSVSGFVGSAITLVLAAALGLLIHAVRGKQRTHEA